MLQKLFKRCYTEQGFGSDGQYDWSMPTHPSHVHDSPNQSQTEQSPPRRQYKKIHKTNTNSIEIIELKSKAPTPTKKRKDRSSDNSDVPNKKKQKNTITSQPRMKLRPRKRSTTTPPTPPHVDIIEISDDDS